MSRQFVQQVRSIFTRKPIPLPTTPVVLSTPPVTGSGSVLAPATSKTPVARPEGIGTSPSPKPIPEEMAELDQPEQPSNATDSAENAADEEGSDEVVEKTCQPCLGKWIIVTITRHTKVIIDNWVEIKDKDKKTVLDKNGKPKQRNEPYWDCTLGDLKMEYAILRIPNPEN